MYTVLCSLCEKCLIEKLQWNLFWENRLWKKNTLLCHILSLHKFVQITGCSSRWDSTTRFKSLFLPVRVAEVVARLNQVVGVVNGEDCSSGAPSLALVMVDYWVVNHGLKIQVNILLKCINSFNQTFHRKNKKDIHIDFICSSVCTAGWSTKALAMFT